MHADRISLNTLYQRETIMKDFRTIAIAAALGLGIVSAPSFAQNRTPPADPNSPGAVVIPDNAKGYRDRDKSGQKSDQNMRDRDYRDGAAGRPGTKDPAREDPGTQAPASPRPQRSDG